MEESIGFSKFKAFVNTANDYPSTPSVVTLNKAVKLMKEMAEALEESIMDRRREEVRLTGYYRDMQDYQEYNALKKFKEWK